MLQPVDKARTLERLRSQNALFDGGRSEQQEQQETEEIESFLIELQRLGVTLRVEKEGKEDRLYANPRSLLTADLTDQIIKHKDRLIRAVQDARTIQMLQDEKFRRTGILQNTRHVLELARECLGERP